MVAAMKMDSGDDYGDHKSITREVACRVMVGVERHWYMFWGCWVLTAH